ncbi:MAG TPA: LEA type 2 family protein [Chitinophagaceae bacterium]|nr:LEA type 2 family protein [Chitinophagaceae bacterium]
MKTILSILSIPLFILCSCKGTNNVQEPEYRDIRNIRLISLGPLESTAGVDLVYYNPNDFGVQVATARGDIYVDNNYFGRFELDQKVQVRKNSEFTLPATVRVDMIGAVKNQRDLYKKKEALVKIQGMATLRKAGFSKEVPINYEHMQDIERFRTLVTTRQQ